MKKYFYLLFLLSSTWLSAQWTMQHTHFEAPMRGISNISIVDENIVWALAFDGSGNNTNVQEFTKTVDGGNTWIPGVINIGSPNSGIANITAVSATTAWVAVFPLAVNQAKGIYKTTDGGITWNRQNTALFNHTDSFPDLVYFFDENHGFCAGDPVNGVFECYTTNNAGENWIPVLNSNLPSPLVAGEYINSNSFCRYQNSFWFWSNHGRLFHSTNKGESFTVYQYPILDFGSYPQNYRLTFNNATLGMLTEESGLFWITNDCGQNWNMDFTDTGIVYSNDLAAVPDTTILFTVGSNGSTYSLDPYEGGPSFVTIDNLNHTCVEFIDSNTGWSGGFNTNSQVGGIYKWNGNLANQIVESEINFKYFPNPFQNFITIESTQTLKNIEIYNIVGQCISKVKPLTSQYNVNTQYFTSGIYQLKVQTDKGHKTISIYKE